jgi:putative Mg2+ transporter-C (MgtC) family protein
MDTLEIALRIGAAAVLGIAIGLNRDLAGKAMGVRTLGLVGVGAAVAVLAVSESSITDASRVVQGIVTGIGFLGVGAIMRSADGKEVHGLTTAACAWLTACVGAACGIASWPIILVSVPFIFIILHLGGPFERAVHRCWPFRKRATTEIERRTLRQRPRILPIAVHDCVGAPER